LDIHKYKVGWLIVAFDLPVGTKPQRKAAHDFREWLKDDGFQMLQWSLYARPCVSNARHERQNALRHPLSMGTKFCPPRCASQAAPSRRTSCPTPTMVTNSARRAGCDYPVCFSRFWNQGKARGANPITFDEFASAAFGIKAKPSKAFVVLGF
jgi:hypothetical protein